MAVFPPGPPVRPGPMKRFQVEDRVQVIDPTSFGDVNVSLFGLNLATYHRAMHRVLRVRTVSTSIAYVLYDPLDPEFPSYFFFPYWLLEHAAGSPDVITI